MPRSLLRSKRKASEDDELNMVPIMNMFLVLIPFLLMSASFFHIKAINTSLPVLADGLKNEGQKQDVKVTLIVALKPDSISLSAISEDLSHEQLTGLDSKMPKEADGSYPLELLSSYLQRVKNLYPASDTLILIPDQGVIYDTIIRTMDVARKTEMEPLFPNVVLSGSVG
jgi:biopolymer transport protein ExbD